MLTPRQQSKYRPLVERAWQAECSRAGQSPGIDHAHETWYRQQLLDACGIYSTKQADPVNDYDALMLHFAILAGDQALIDYFSRAAERRHLHNIRRSINQGAVTEAYVLGIARNMGFIPQSKIENPKSQILEELPADHLWRIWNALIRHNKRHQQERVLKSA
ncbi:MAG: hypothetical protein WC047_05095 [Kiritimatiellales bacterium]